MGKSAPADLQAEAEPKTTAGWLGWSWVDCLNDRTQTAERTTLGNAAAICKRLAGFDVDYIWTSQTNLKDMLPGNWLEFNRRHFHTATSRRLPS